MNQLEKRYPLVQTDRDFQIRLAQQEDFAQIHELLRRSELPLTGVSPAGGRYYAAIFADAVIGVVGAEFYGTAAMLRSLAVSPCFQKRGVAQALLQHVLQIVQAENTQDAYLLTNTAKDYMARYGFKTVERSAVPAHVLAGSALGSACPASSTCMHLAIQSIK